MHVKTSFSVAQEDYTNTYYSQKKLNIWRDFGINGEAICSALASLLAPTVPRLQQHDFDFKWPRCLNVIFSLSAIIMLGTLLIRLAAT